MNKTLQRFGPIVGLLSKHHGLATRTQLNRLGLPDRTIADWVGSGGLEQLSCDVFRLPGLGWTWDSKLAAAAMISAPIGAVGYRSAAAYWELSGFARNSTEITAPLHQLKPHRLYDRRESKDLSPIDITTVRGLRVTTPERTLIDVARFISEDRLGRMIDDAQRRNLITFDGLALRFLELARKGRPGVVKLRTVLEFRSPMLGPEATTFEEAFERLVERAGFPTPVRQHEINVEGHRYYVDHAWPEFGGGSECDSMLAHGTPEQLASDLERQNRITDDGFWLKRFTHRDVMRRPEYVIAELARKLPRR